MTTPSKTLDLRGLTEAKRNTKVNVALVRLAGWTDIEFYTDSGQPMERDPSAFWRGIPPGETLFRTPPPYATSADAVLPLLEKRTYETGFYVGGRHAVHFPDGDITGAADTFALAACIALLRAHGWEVLT